MMQAVLTRLEILVAVLVLLAGVKSAYSGTVRGLIENIREIPPMREKVDEIDSRQEDMIDGMVALSISEGADDLTVDTERLARDLRDGNSYRVYIDRNGRPNPYAVDESDRSDERNDDD